MTSEFNYIYKAKVVRVVDGDTLDLKVDLGFQTWTHERFRLAHVDTWEPRGENRERGKAATAFVASNFPEGSSVVVKTVKDTTGKYGRYLAGAIWNLAGVEIHSLLVGSEHEKGAE